MKYTKLNCQVREVLSASEVLYVYGSQVKRTLSDDACEHDDLALSCLCVTLHRSMWHNTLAHAKLLSTKQDIHKQPTIFRAQ